LFIEENSNKHIITTTFPVLVGIDTAFGQAVTQGNLKLYHKLLAKFQSSQSDFVSQFKLSQQEKDKQSAERCAHSLRGSAGNIGATKVSKAAEKLELACSENATDVEELLTDLEKELSVVLDSLSKLNSENTAKEIKGLLLDQTQFQELLTKLQILLEDDDTDAIGVIDELKALSGVSKYSSTLNKLTKAVEVYNFDQGLEVLAKLKIQA
jgi:HPt (histidine-containing phosphotransfer) domain-containing protein